VGSELDPVALQRLYAAHFPAAGMVRANMVTSLDGRVTTQGRSAGLSSKGDKDVFAVLRSLADVIVVGAGTFRAEVYGPATIRPELRTHRRDHGQELDPPIAIVTRALAFDDLSMLEHERMLVVTCRAAGQHRLSEVGERCEVIVAGEDEVDLADALAQLADRGLRQVLCEGGPSLLGALAQHQLIDELCLTLAPLIAGGDGPGLMTAAPPTFDARYELIHVLEDDGFLLGRYRVSPSDGS
jgi:riboflavin biosynthesis pyrimidine reductase